MQALCKKNDRDAGCQKEVERILCMIIVDKGMKGKTGTRHFTSRSIALLDIKAAACLKRVYVTG